MTKLINKEDEKINLYFSLDDVIEGEFQLEIVSDFTNKSTSIELPQPEITNERYTLFILQNPFENYLDGLYTYHLKVNNSIIQSGNMKIQSSDFGDNHFQEFIEDGDDFIVIED
ncbi:hypothetical protein CHU00_14865 [Sphingobacterium cellulitidis]|uniref:hypothetical protein n=1 Tax=Sphingobacterium cellulitidis TaxID=1768011 RepID=UPI000B93D05B|nr:hypothetical protein [Sphingobacterium cellulitidis]OYD44893.1 hypothetical protein CHU00_14865 [Sphingobacterium cellulitidis]